MHSLIIEGGTPLNGEINISGNKNAALPIIAATLLTDAPVLLKNIPRIHDVDSMLDIFSYLGGDVSIEGNNVSLHAKNILHYTIPKKLCQKLRASILFIAPILYRMGKVELYPPGGDIIGCRRLDTHFYGLTKLGAKITHKSHQFYIEQKKLKGAHLFLDEASVTATEQILIASSFSQGKTILYNAASEPHVQDLCAFLQKMGVTIQGIGTNKLIIQGIEKFSGLEYTISHDYIEAGSYLAIVAASEGSLKISNITRESYWMINRIFDRLGVTLQFDKKSIQLDTKQNKCIKNDLNNLHGRIDDGPWPQFPSDLMSIMILLATQCHGSILFFEKMFESRLFFIDHLKSMGANIILCDPHRIIVQGKTQLYPAKLNSPDIRAGMTLLGAALLAKGKSHIFNSQIIHRGYENFVEKLTSLGAKIRIQ